MLSRSRSVKNLLLSLGIPLCVGGLASFLSLDAFGRYGTEATLPALAPPGWLFPIVWTLLYLAMGYGAYRVWVTPSQNRAPALLIYAVQLFLNFLWTPLFFNGRLYWFAFVWVVLLWLSVLILTVLFYTVDRAAGIMQVPYLLWVTFAAWLNFQVASLNV